ncbi:hypothetical protein AK812_SmicGene37992 [Symbiodinium microadriaticum]|uniref:CCHC-type domain-containing protein n=1 Tax=Symbiodinium microadriaticum TaxID=2951 RepID=A0A1Q9CEV7_SYMMI|nr:hypothetical protein AK812_SmicGene37992 [Symbiodinium microadriaticum]
MAEIGTASQPEPSSSFQLPWQAIPKFIPGTTDVTEYSKKLQFLAAMWPKEHLSLLAPRAALMCEGSSFKKVASLDAGKLKANDDSGVKLLVATLGGSWGKTALEEKYDSFEKAIYGTTQKADETNDSYLARHDIHFEELLAAGVTLSEVRAYILLRQSQLSSDDRKRIVVEMNGKLEYQKVCTAIRLLGSRFFTDLQGQRSGKTKTYDANHVDENIGEEPERAYQAAVTASPEDGDGELDSEFLDALVMAEDQDAMQVQAFEDELEGFFQETPELQEALVSYLEARGRLLAKKRSRGFWPIGSGAKGSKGGRSTKGGKGKGKNAREQLLARISRSHCRACGEKGHWKAECPKFGKQGLQAGRGETATTTVAQVAEPALASTDDSKDPIAEVCADLPEGTLSLEEAHFASCSQNKGIIQRRLMQVVENLRASRPNPSARRDRQPSSGETSSTDPAARKLNQGSHESPAEVLPDATMALHSNGPIEAILDTGASRCVMGKRLVSGFLSQLDEAVHKKNTSLGERYARMNNPQLRYTPEEIRTMPIEELGKLTIDFGKTMNGRTYMDVAENEVQWTKWIVEHMGKSTKQCHLNFLTFVERYVSQAEAVEDSLLESLEAPEPPATRARPKATAKSSASRAAASTDAVPEAWDVVSTDDLDPPIDHQVSALATRMSQMESMMHQVLGAIQDLNTVVRSS